MQEILEAPKTLETALPPKLLFTLAETASLLSISTKTVRRLLERDLLKTNPALRTKLITRNSILAFAQMTL